MIVLNELGLFYRIADIQAPVEMKEAVKSFLGNGYVSSGGLTGSVYNIISRSISGYEVFDAVVKGCTNESVALSMILSHSGESVHVVRKDGFRYRKNLERAINSFIDDNKELFSLYSVSEFIGHLNEYFSLVEKSMFSRIYNRDLGERNYFIKIMLMPNMAIIVMDK